MLKSKCNIEQVTKTDDDAGSWTESWTPLYHNLSCRIEALSGNEATVTGKEGVIVTHRVFLEYKSTITEEHRVKIGTRYFDIKHVDNPGEIDHHLELKVLEIT